MTDTDAAPAPETAKEEAKKEEPRHIVFDDFLKIDLRVAQILAAERIEKSEKLVKLQLSLGAELGERQIVAGIAKHYSVDELLGRKIVIVANLKPAKLMGEVSNGMLLAASDAEGTLALLSPGDAMPAGSRVG
jgi:methionyl-tRNA synthetase